MKKVVHKFASILFWSVIAAAFIGPGTVTTAARAGAVYHTRLSWALLFSTFACVVLQEAVVRMRIITGMSLGQAIRHQYRHMSVFHIILLLVSGAILLGSAAYETGNILGAVQGILIMFRGHSWIWVALIGSVAFVLLAVGAEQSVARILGSMVAIMGVVFLYTAIASKPDPWLLLKGTFVPEIPDAGLSGILILGLVGTTVVPYNLFLGSGLDSRQQTIRDMRLGLITAIVLGGIISMSVLVVGSMVDGPFSFGSLVVALSSKMGRWAVVIFGVGMLAAGFTSAVTAPLASAITARDLFAPAGDRRWGKGSFRFTLVWVAVLGTGLAFGMTGVKPVPAIILAQAFNGMILPGITLFLFSLINDPEVMGKEGVNSPVNNLLMFLVNVVAWVLGLWQLFMVVVNTAHSEMLHPERVIPAVILLAIVLNTLFLILVLRRRNKKIGKWEKR